MHTLASKIKQRSNGTEPRFYYRLSRKTSCGRKIINFFRLFLTFMFTQVGVIVLIGLYMLLGAVIFQNIEADSQMDLAEEAEKVDGQLYANNSVSGLRTGKFTAYSCGD